MKLLIFLTLFISSSVFAGGSRAGNGGDGVYCPTSPGQPLLQLLDFYELTFYDNETVDLGDVNEDPIVTVTKIIDSFKKISPIRADNYRERLQNFLSRIQWSQTPLQDISDSNHIVLPTGCEIRQLVIQSKVNGIPTYKVDQNLWHLLNGTQKAGLLLHEIIYEEALNNDQTNSINTRELVRYFAKKKLANLTDFNELNTELIRLEFYRLVEIAFDNGDVGLLSMNNRYAQVDHAGLDKVEFCGYLQKATGVFVNNCSDPYNSDFEISGFNGSWKYASKQINRIYSRKTNSILYMIQTKDLNLDFPILDFSTWGFIPAKDITFENRNFKAICEKGYWATLSRELEYNYFEMDKNSVIDCGNPKNANSRKFLKLDKELYEYQKYSDFSDIQGQFYFNLLKTATIMVGRNKIQVETMGLSPENKVMIISTKNIKFDLGKNGFCELESSASITFLDDADESIEISLPRYYPYKGVCQVRFNGQKIKASWVKVSKKGTGTILDAK